MAAITRKYVIVDSDVHTRVPTCEVPQPLDEEQLTKKKKGSFYPRLIENEG